MESCKRRSRRIVGLGVVEGTTRRPTESTNLGLTETELPARESSWDWSRPSFVMWQLCNLASCETSNSGIWGCSWLCCLLWGQIPPTRFPYLIWIEKEVSTVTATWCTMTGWYPWRTCLFWEETMEEWLRTEWEGWKRAWGGEELRRREKLGCKNRTTKTKQQKIFNFFIVLFFFDWFHLFLKQGLFL